ncbi:MAG: class I SAM-dependent methyltransferase [Desulfobacterales bacterium]|nr:MAG: class I SAM-dependent methyltransferase [Desulfobacterales bacterium]
MPIWIWIFIILAGTLFGLKMFYVLCIAAALPATQGALYVSTARARIAAVVEAVPMKPGQLLVDLGCGDGRILRYTRKNWGVRAIGYEVNLLAYLKARVLSIGLKNIEIRLKNFWSQNLADADVVFCYLYPDVMQKLSDKLKGELKPGTVVVSCNFALPGFQLVRVLRPAGLLHNDPIYVYKV